MWSRVSLRPRTMAGQFLVLQLTVLLAVLAVASVVSIQQSDEDFRTTRGARLRAAAENLANTSPVRQPVVNDRLDDPRRRSSVASYLQRKRNEVQASGVYVADPEGRIVVSSDFAGRGQGLDLGESTVQDLRTWTGDVDDLGKRSIAAQVPVIDNAGELAGIVMVAEEYPTWTQRARGILPDLAAFLGIGLALGLVGSWLLARLVKRRTRGLEPAEIAALADQREALLHSLREGVVSVAEDGTMTLVSDSARELLGLPAGVEGRRLDDLALPPGVRTALTGEATVRDEVLVVDGRVVVVNRNPVRQGGRQVATVTTLRDRTELLALQSELSARESITNTLRAQTHEFHNQLHTISGLVQLEEYDEVARLVGTLSRRRAEISDAVLSRVDDPAVAALLIAKVSVAAERGVDLVLSEESSLPRLDAEHSTDVGTVLGNLVDNAVDASVSVGGTRVWVDLRTDGRDVVVEVADSGPGVPPDQVGQIFERGWSTKPAGEGGRGVGLALVQVVCERRGGGVAVLAGDRGGAVFRASLPGLEELAR